MRRATTTAALIPTTGKSTSVSISRSSMQRLMQSTGNDAFAIDYGGIQPENLTTVFADAHTANPRVRRPRVQRLRPVHPLLLDQHSNGPQPEIRQAMAAALDRSSDPAQCRWRLRRRLR